MTRRPRVVLWLWLAADAYVVVVGWSTVGRLFLAATVVVGATRGVIALVDRRRAPAAPARATTT